MRVILLLLVSLLGMPTSAATMEQVLTGTNVLPVKGERRTQALENCQADLAGGGIAAMLTSGLYYFYPSFVDRCAASLPMDVDNTLSHLYNLDGIFEQFYAFYYLAIDPENSEPMNYQPELGYTVAGEGEGKVDVSNQITDLILDVSHNQAANISTFWSLNAIFADLRDGHVRVPPISGQAIVEWSLRVFPARTLYKEVYAKPEFTWNSTGDLVLTIHWEDPTGSSIPPSVVETVGGITVRDFLFYMANTRSVQLAFQSVGARINQLLKIMSSVDYRRFMFPLKFTTKPTDVLPDTFIVRYADGTKEIYVTGVYSPGLLSIMAPTEDDPNVYDLVDRSNVEIVINQPGLAYQLYMEARTKVFNAVNDAIVATDVEKQAEKRLQASSKASKQLAPSYEFDFTWASNEPTLVDGVVEYVTQTVVGYKIEQDYAVLKIGTFLIDPDEFAYFWGNMTAAAKDKGVTKLIIDISGNGGGYGLNSLTLAVSMFPYVEYKWFQNNMDATYNKPMDDYVVLVEPIVKIFEKYTQRLTNQHILHFIDSISEDQKVALKITARALTEFCLQNTAEFCENRFCSFSCPILQKLKSEIETFLLYPTPPAYLGVWNQLFTVVRELNAWTGTLAGWKSVKLGNEDYSYHTIVRGGMEYNVTSRSSLMSLEEYNEAAVKALQLRHSFNEYLIVSDGTAGSASSVFSSAVEQIWKNRDRSGAEASVTTVSFGGTGDKADLTMARVPASVEDVSVDNAQYTTISLLLFPMLLPVMVGNLRDWFNRLIDVAIRVDDATYSPPYFAQKLPRIPVQNYYDPFMGPGALPLQYIKMQPDEYIQKFFFGTTFSDNYDLATLYSESSIFFSQSTGTSSTAAADTTGSSNIFDHGGMAEPVATVSPTVTAEAPAEEIVTGAPTEVMISPPPNNAPTTVTDNPMREGDDTTGSSNIFDHGEMDEPDATASPTVNSEALAEEIVTDAPTEDEGLPLPTNAPTTATNNPMRGEDDTTNSLDHGGMEEPVDATVSPTLNSEAAAEEVVTGAPTEAMAAPPPTNVPTATSGGPSHGVLSYIILISAATWFAEAAAI